MATKDGKDGNRPTAPSAELAAPRQLDRVAERLDALRRAPPARTLAELRAQHDAADQCVLDSVRAFIGEPGMRPLVSRMIDGFHAPCTPR